MKGVVLLIPAFLLTASVCPRAQSAPPSQQTPGIDPEALIEQILTVEAKQRLEIADVVFDAECITGSIENDGSFEEEKRFIKKVCMKYLPDTIQYRVKYLACYKGGEIQKPEECDKEAVRQAEMKARRKTRDISYPTLSPFYPEHRDQYEIIYEGVAADRIDGYTCHHFRVQSKEERSDRVSGDYYFEAASFNLVKVDFSPAKLEKGAMFTLDVLNMSIMYGPTPQGWWLPRRFQVEGKSRTALLIGVKFATTEYYRNPQVNTGLKAEAFEANND